MTTPNARGMRPKSCPPSHHEPLTDQPAQIASKDDWSKSFSAFLAETPAPPAGTGPASERDWQLCETFRHGGWRPVRERVHKTMLSMSHELPPRRIAAFAGCGSDATVEVRLLTSHATPEYRIRSTKCHDRFCVPCSNERSRLYQTVLLQHMATLDDLSLVTLTIKQSDATLTECLDRITRHFRTLRSKPMWKAAVKGGAAIIETKIGGDGQSWNCHFHIVCQAKYLDQADLSAIWLAITGDSTIVDIRRVGARSGAIKYITKYVTKAADASLVNSPKHLREAIIGFTGRRLVSTFGTWRGLVLSENPDAEQKSSESTTDWRTLGSLGGILSRAVAGHAEELAIVRKLVPWRFERPKQPDPPY